MKYLRTSYLKRKRILQFLLCLFFVGICIGIIFYIKQGQINKENILSSMNLFKDNLETRHINNILTHLIVNIMIFVLAFLVIGVPLSIIYLFYEGLSVGFSIAVFYSTYKVRGFLFGLLFNIISKTSFILLLIIFTVKILDIGRNIIGSLIYRQNKLIKSQILLNTKKGLLLIAIFLINDLIIYFLGHKIILLFSFLLS